VKTPPPHADVSKGAPPGAHERSLIEFLDQIDAEAAGWKKKYDGGKWSRMLDVYRGKNLRGTYQTPWFEANVLGNALDRKNSILTEVKPTIHIAARRQGLTSTQDTIQRTINALWDEKELDMQLESLVHFASTFGCGGFLIGWDPMADYGRGDMALRAFDPRALAVDPAVTRSYELDAGQYVRMDSVQSLWDLQRWFPGRGQFVRPDPRVSASEEDSPAGGPISHVISRLSNAFRGTPRADGPIPRAFVREYRFRDPSLTEDGRLRFPRGRRILRGGDDVVLLDAENEYWDGGYPLELLDLRPDPDHAFGRSEVEALRRLQEGLNRMGHAFVENAILVNNVWVVADQDSLTPDSINRLNNIGGIVITKRFGREVTRHPPPEMPAHFLNWINFAVQMIDLLAGLTDSSMQGRGRVELRSAEQLEGLQQAAEVLIRAQARRLESFLQRVGQKLISRLFQFYTEDRFLSYIGPGEEWAQFQFDRWELVGEIFRQATQELEAREIDVSSEAGQEVLTERLMAVWKDFRFRVSPGSSLASSRVRRSMMMGMLAENLMMPRSRILKELGYENGTELMREALAEAQQYGMPGGDKDGKKKSKGMFG
jgi:hypothetical protein